MSKAEKDMQNSANRFKRIVWPQIQEWFGDNPNLIKTEDDEDRLRTAFDRVAGVDFWVVEKNEGMMSIASRVQTYDKTTFTIRYQRSSGNDTEYQKRIKQLNSDHELPTYTVQAYIDPTLEVLRNAAACKTRSLYEYISDGTPGEDWRLIGSDEAELFFPVRWSELDSEAELRVYDRVRAGLDVKPSGQAALSDWH